MALPPDLEATLRSRLATFEATHLARTLEHDPHSTIEPPRARDANPAAIALLDALAQRASGIALERTLGEGGMGVVHLATQQSLGRHVAVKTFREGDADPSATLKLLREAWVTGAVEHPNVVPIHDIAVDASGRPLVVMKRIEGVEWGSLMHAPEAIAARFGSKDPIEWNLRVFTQVCNAIQCAHSRAVLHRDLKPENVMIGAFGEVYVVDWGLAVALAPDPSGRLPLASEATEIAGTPCYMAPEMMLADAARFSPRTDVYLLGAILYEIFAGHPPHQGDTMQALVASVLVSEPAFPPRFPSEAARLCRRALAREPEGRFESAEALRVAVEEYLRHRGSRRLAWEARQSLERLLEALRDTSRGDERTLEAYRLLGECRFGYRAALSAWEGNEAARRGLDRALGAVVEHELADGDPNAAAALLREIAEPPAELPARVQAAVQARAAEEERLRQLGADLDASVGTRTRTVVGGGLGVLWTLMPLLMWAWERHGGGITHAAAIVSSIVLLALAVGVWAWARETLTRTLLNRRLSATLAMQFGAQIAIAVGAMLAGIDARRTILLWVLSWSMTIAMLAIWVERWFAVSATVTLLCFLAGAAYPVVLRPAMSVANLVLTLVIVGIWFPRQDLELLRARREELARRTRRILLDRPNAPHAMEPDSGG